MTAASAPPADTTSQPRPTARRTRRHRRALLIALALVLVLIAALTVVSWHFSSAVLVPNRSPHYPTATIQSVAPGQVVLSRSDDSSRPGVYGLDWPGGHAMIEGIVSRSPGTVTRRLTALSGRLAKGSTVSIDPNVYAGNPRTAFGFAFAEVRIPDELGPMPAWMVPGRARHARTWTIFVHGINADRHDGLRIVPALHAAGSPALLISYREDAGAPPSPDGLHHMGLTEWRDLQAAARYALAHGARRLVLAGYSMGGAIVTQFMEHSPLARRVAGLVLDSPALDWQAILSFNAEQLGLPSFAALPVEWAIGARIDAAWTSLDALDHTAAFHVPILLFHGTADSLVPISTSNAFAKALPSWTTYYRVPGAEHVGSWNVNPALYDRRLAAFLKHVGA